ncbi:MAG TPA: MBL fold metallo-hydrolase, partial [Planctomycetota bacterium]|nr:MBL fold metallo-hydrolase [Planctomycetota bacterium]
TFGALALSAASCVPLASGTSPAPSARVAPAHADAPEPGAFPERWIRGGPDCGTEPAIQVWAYNPDFFVLRQSLCTSFEAPFLYLIFGREKVLLVDTGAGDVAIQPTVAGVIQDWLASSGSSSVELVVVHTHGHRDHTSGDAQFEGQPNTTLVPASVPALQDFFGIPNWPTDSVPYDLGGRVLDVIPIPGHHPSHIALYDRRTQLLLTGDTLYPGRLYVVGASSQGQWPVYQASVRRLVDFAAAHPVRFVLGAHIEMTNVPGEQLAFRSTHHPNEHALQLRPEHLLELDSALSAMGSTPRMQIHDHFVIYPMN